MITRYQVPVSLIRHCCVPVFYVVRSANTMRGCQAGPGCEKCALCWGDILIPSKTKWMRTRDFFRSKSPRIQKIIKTFNKKLKNVSCEYDRVNGWDSTLQAAWYIRHVRIIWFLWTKRTIWLLILSFTQNIVRACSMFYPQQLFTGGHINQDPPYTQKPIYCTFFANHIWSLLLCSPVNINTYLYSQYYFQCNSGLWSTPYVENGISLWTEPGYGKLSSSLPFLEPSFGAGWESGTACVGVHHTPLGRLSMVDISTAVGIVSVPNKLDVGNVSPRASRKRTVPYWHPLGCLAIGLGKIAPGGVVDIHHRIPGTVKRSRPGAWRPSTNAPPPSPV